MDGRLRHGGGGRLPTADGPRVASDSGARIVLSLRTQPWAQFALLAAAVGVMAVAQIYGNGVLTTAALAGFGLILAGAIASGILARVQPQSHTGWIALIPLAALVGIPLIRNDALEVVDGIGFMMVFPLVWLGAGFSLPPIVVGILLAGAIPLMPSISAGRAPDSAPEWIAFGLFLAFAALIALSAFGTGHQLRREVANREAALASSEAAAEARERLSAILQAVSEATDNAVLVFGPDGSVLTANDAARRLARLAGIDLTGEPALAGRKIYSADRRTPLFPSPQTVTALARSGEVRGRIAWLGDSDQVAVSYSARPIFRGGEPLGTVLIAHDVTDLVEAIEVRDRFLDAVNHELRTPLTVLMGETELAQTEEVSPRVAARLERVDSAAQRLFTTVEHLLSAYRTSVRALPNTTSVALTVGDVIERLSSLAREHEVTVAFTDHGVQNASVDARSLGGIIEELLRNAVLLSPRGATVAVHASRERDRPMIEITDSGVGMSDSERRRAFDRFYRTDFAREQAVPGVGLGLSIARNLADANGISIELEPGPSGGTRARLTLPPASPAAGALG